MVRIIALLFAALLSAEALSSTCEFPPEIERLSSSTKGALAVRTQRASFKLPAQPEEVLATPGMTIFLYADKKSIAYQLITESGTPEYNVRDLYRKAYGIDSSMGTTETEFISKYRAGTGIGCGAGASIRLYLTQGGMEVISHGSADTQRIYFSEGNFMSNIELIGFSSDEMVSLISTIKER